MVLRCLLAGCLLLVSAVAGASEEIATPAGVFELPDGFVPVAAQGHAAPGGRQYIFVRDGEYAPRAVFTMMVTALGAAPAVDVAVVASQFGDPTMVVPNGRPARRVKVGGIAGRRHSTTMRNDMVVTAYAVDNLGHRLLVQLKYPRSPDYRADALRFEDAVRAFRWGLPTTPLPPLVAVDPEVATDLGAPMVAPAPAVATAAADTDPEQATGSVWNEVERVAPGLPGDAATTNEETSPAPATDAAAAPLGAVWEDVERVGPAAPAAAEPAPAPAPADAMTPPLGAVWEDVERVAPVMMAPAPAENAPEPPAPADVAVLPDAPAATVESDATPAPADVALTPEPAEAVPAEIAETDAVVVTEPTVAPLPPSASAPESPAPADLGVAPTPAPTAAAPTPAPATAAPDEPAPPGAAANPPAVAPAATTELPPPSTAGTDAEAPPPATATDVPPPPEDATEDEPPEADGEPAADPVP